MNCLPSVGKFIKSTHIALRVSTPTFNTFRHVIATYKYNEALDYLHLVYITGVYDLFFRRIIFWNNNHITGMNPMSEQVIDNLFRDHLFEQRYLLGGNPLPL